MVDKNSVRSRPHRCRNRAIFLSFINGLIHISVVSILCFFRLIKKERGLRYPGTCLKRLLAFNTLLEIADNDI